MSADAIPLPLPELGPMSERDWLVWAHAYNAGRVDESKANGEEFDRGYLAGTQCLLDIEAATQPPAKRARHLTLVAS